MAHAKLVMVAGGGTSWRQMGITLFALLTHPDQFAAVKADRALLADAIEEGLRWNPTAPYFYRMVMNDTEFYGHQIPAGSVLVSVGASTVVRSASTSTSFIIW